MSDLLDKVYREKYLKYKKKYLIALENMKGGLKNQPLTSKSKIYFCNQETYERLQKSGRDDNLMYKNLDTNDECFLERLKAPNVSLMLENNELKVVGGTIQYMPNYPILSGRRFGIKEEKTDKKNLLGKSGIKELSFDYDFAMMQLKDAQPIIKETLDKLNKQITEKIYFLHTNDKDVSYNGVLEYSPFPSFNDFLKDPNLFNKSDQKGGMGDTIFYFCNPAATDAINTHYFKNSDSPALANEKCICDIALDKLASQTPKFGYVKAKDDSMYILDERSLSSKNTRLIIHVKLGEEVIDNPKKGFWFSSKVTKYSEDNIRKQLSTILSGNILTLLGVTNDSEISIFKLHGGSLSKFSKSSETVP